MKNKLFFQGTGTFSLGDKTHVVDSDNTIEVDKILAALTVPEIQETRVAYTFPYYYIIDDKGKVIAYRTSPYTIKELKEYAS